MKIWFLIVSLVCLSACAKPPIYVTPDLRPYVARYAAYKLQYTGSPYLPHVNAWFADLSAPELAACFYHGTHKLIEVDEQHWKHSTDTEHEIVILHEMGHCDLNLNHAKGYSIMAPSGIQAADYLAHKDYYLNLLFNQGV